MRREEGRQTSLLKVLRVRGEFMEQILEQMSKALQKWTVSFSLHEGSDDESDLYCPYSHICTWTAMCLSAGIFGFCNYFNPNVLLK